MFRRASMLAAVALVCLPLGSRIKLATAVTLRLDFIASHIYHGISVIISIPNSNAVIQIEDMTDMQARQYLNDNALEWGENVN